MHKILYLNVYKYIRIVLQYAVDIENMALALIVK